MLSLSKLNISSGRRFLHNLSISPKIASAVSNNQPIVSLESTIISHGMPFPTNIKVARLVERAVIEEGALPATIAIMNGVPRIGIDNQELELLGDPNSGLSIWKASRRDLPYICAMKHTASTTVASTMILSHLAKIPIFATGGIGGVHYGAESTMDISADLTELGRTPVAVVCAGIKSILDLNLTMEVLETNGVPVVSTSYICHAIAHVLTYL